MYFVQIDKANCAKMFLSCFKNARRAIKLLLILTDFGYYLAPWKKSCVICVHAYCLHREKKESHVQVVKIMTYNFFFQTVHLSFLTRSKYIVKVLRYFAQVSHVSNWPLV